MYKAWLRIQSTSRDKSNQFDAVLAFDLSQSAYSCSREVPGLWVKGGRQRVEAGPDSRAKVPFSGAHELGDSGEELQDPGEERTHLRKARLPLMRNWSHLQ